MSAPPPHPAERIPCLDGLRAVSIVLVLVGHGLPTVPGSDALGRAAPYLGNASLGVLAFFVISGFLITHLLRREWERMGTIRLGHFYRRRAYRILPAFLTYLAVVAVLRTLGWVHTTYADIAVAGAFLTNYKHCFPVPTNDDYWFVGHFWTLSLEEQFYLFWPATILVVGRTRSPWVAAAIIVLTPIVRVATYFVWPAARGQLGMMLHTAADPLMFGALAALLQGRPGFERILARLTSWVWPVLAVLFVFGPSKYLEVSFRGAYTTTAGLFLNALALTFVMVWLTRNSESIAGRGLSTTVCRRIGMISYSLYLWQQLFLTTRNESPLGAFPLNVIMCFIAAELSYRNVEVPFLRIRDHARASENN